MLNRTLAVVAAAAALALLIWSLGGPAPKDPKPVLPVEPAAPTEPPSSASQATPLPEGTPARAEVPSAKPSENSLAGLQLEVVLAATGTPLPTADVRFREVKLGWLKPNLGGLLVRQNFLDSRRLAPFKEAEPEGNGHFRLPEPQEGLVVVATLEMKTGSKLTGYAFLGPLFGNAASSTVRLELAPMGLRTVRVVGRDGLPLADHPVVISATAAWGKLDTPGRRTDKAGEFELRNIDSVLGPLVQGGQVTLETTAWNGEPTRLQFPADRAPPGPLVLVVDSGARVELHAVDANGQLVTDREVRFRFSKETEMRPANKVVWAEPNGIALIDGVIPGTKVSAYEFRDLDSENLAERTVEGVVEQGAPLVLNVPTARYPHILVTGRLVDGAGAPLPETPLDLVVVSDGKPLRRPDQSTTDADGHFSIDRLAPFLGKQNKPDTKTVFRLTSIASDGDFADSEPWLGPLPVAPAQIELGDVVLGPPPALVTGTVVDAAGKPLEGALVRMGQKMETELPNFFFIPINGVTSKPTDAAGHFELTGPPPAGELVVRASKEGYIDSLDADCESGDRDLRIQLFKGGRMGGFLLMGDTKAIDWDVGIWPEGEGAHEVFVPKPLSKSWHTSDKWAYSAPFPKNGIFAWIELPPGSYSVRVISRSGGDEVAHVTGILVKAGEDCRDPRLQGIDVSASLAEVELRVRDINGAVVDMLEVGLINAADQRVEYFSASGGSKVLHLKTVPREVFVRAPGFEIARFMAFAGANDVVLEPDQRLELRLPEGLDWSRAGSPKAYLKCNDWHYEMVYQIEHPFNDEGRAYWGIGAPGEYRVTLRAPAWKDATDPALRSFSQTITVPEEGALAVPIVLSITQADLDAR